MKEGCRIPSLVRLNPTCNSPPGLFGPELRGRGGITGSLSLERGGLKGCTEERKNTTVFSSQGICGFN